VLWRGAQALRLTPREFDLAWLLFSNTTRLVSHAELLAGLWGMGEAVDTHTLSQHVYSLRRKLDLAAHGFRLRSVYGNGYRLMPPGEADEA
jgi:DNA-binding response OmpR family regulator